jgi:succinate dehydrogenase/fumarate reductase flavoprotein subunit
MSIDTYTSKLTSRTSVSQTLPPSCMSLSLMSPSSSDGSFADTKKSARELARDDLIKVLTYKSGDAVNWLVERFNLDLSKVSRLGGHSEKRTHRGGAQFPGMTITYALMEKVSPGSLSFAFHLYIVL